MSMEQSQTKMDALSNIWDFAGQLDEIQLKMSFSAPASVSKSESNIHKSKTTSPTTALATST